MTPQELTTCPRKTEWAARLTPANIQQWFASGGKDRATVHTSGRRSYRFLGSIVLARRITRPLAELTLFAKRVRDGDYSGRIELSRGDEIAALATSFNHMLEGIAAREAEVLRLAYEDTLTGLPNRAMFINLLAEAVRSYRQTGTPVSFW